MPQISDDFTREMGLSHREFFRTLPAAMGRHKYIVRRNSVEALLGSGSVLIVLSPESERNIASIRVPKTDVRFVFKNVSEEEKITFINYFDKRFQRGGG